MNIVEVSSVENLTTTVKVFVVDVYDIAKQAQVDSRQVPQIKIQNKLVSAACDLLKQASLMVSKDNIINFDLLNLEFPLWFWVKMYVSILLLKLTKKINNHHNTNNALPLNTASTLLHQRQSFAMDTT
ncbi:HBL268Wp [Eremothecium sinecaudum]|uniref:HBL268Wp n=1 Tax=Eremothecium sinecaudum TaxID=45286 RepID=A0A120K0S2_9SACH|nr:HBL268Wp [Eremothecium sinecaudum]AMD18634.1 HBL268Wp [Eremothecium sinecaudum]